MKKIELIRKYKNYGKTYQSSHYQVTEDLIGKYVLVTNYYKYYKGYSYVGIIIGISKVKVVKRLDTDKSRSPTNSIYKYISDRTYYLLDDTEVDGWLL